MYGINKGGLRTNLIVLAASGAHILIGVFLVVFGNTRAITRPELLESKYWSLFVLSLGIGGLLLLIAKGIKNNRRLRLGLGAVSLLPHVAYFAFSIAHRFPTSLVFSAVSVFFLAIALNVDEPDTEAESVGLLPFYAASVLVLLPVVIGLLGLDSYMGIDSSIFLLCALVGIFGALIHLFRRNTRIGAISRHIMAGSLFLLAYAAFRNQSYVTLLQILPTAVVLAFSDLLKHYNLGVPDRSEKYNDETVTVRQFEGLAEIVAWSTFLFAYVHMYFEPEFIGINIFVFAVFALAYVVFTVQYRLLPASSTSYEKFHRSSLTNAILLSVVCHYTGGLQSPYSWFFVFVLISGSIAPQPKLILHRLYVIWGFFLFEALYAYSGEFLNKSILVNQLMPKLFIVSLLGLYAHGLSVRRRKIDADLMGANTSLKKALDREKATSELVTKQAREIGLAKKINDDTLQSLADGVIRLSPDYSVLFMNASAEGLLDVDENMAMGKPIAALIELKREDDDKFKLSDYLTTALRGNAVPLPEDVFLVKGEGAKTFLSGSALPITDEAGASEGVILVLQDISYIREVDQMKTGFLSVAAHQLRTPLSTIRWYLELLNDPTEGKLKKNQKMFAENAYLSLRKMVGLVNRLLAVTRLESGRVPFKPEATDLKAMTHDILGSLKPKLDVRKLEIATDISDMPSVPLDRTLAREVFTNLIENAIRYTSDGGRISIGAKEEKERIVWTVTDTGIGIPKAQQEKIFEKFFRAGNAIEHSSEGSGLGLYLAKFIVEAWGGEIGFTSEDGKGATFRVTVPKSGMKSKEGHVSLNA